MTADQLRHFAARYAAAWCSQTPANVAAFYETDGSLEINGGPPSQGRDAISAAAQSFMTAFPDMVVSLDELRMHGSEATFHWTLTGTNTGPGLRQTGANLRLRAMAIRHDRVDRRLARPLRRSRLSKAIDLVAGRNGNHRLADYNKDPKTSFADIKSVLRISAERLAKELKGSPK